MCVCVCVCARACVNVHACVFVRLPVCVFGVRLCLRDSLRSCAHAHFFYSQVAEAQARFDESFNEELELAEDGEEVTRYYNIYVNIN